MCGFAGQLALKPDRQVDIDEVLGMVLVFSPKMSPHEVSC